MLEQSRQWKFSGRQIDDSVSVGLYGSLTLEEAVVMDDNE